ncbi:MAG: CidA/LrgA family protein [Oscillospiraceae bacterium]|nr:CidA/LrgA family protein [Oscillospiraceae bacterium]
MKYIKQVSLILLFSFLGEVCRFFIPINIPASIYGIGLLFAALALKLIRVEDVRETGSFLTSLLPLLFVAPTVGLLEYWELVKPVLVPFALISFVVTIFVFAAAGLVTKWIIGRRAKKHD